MKEINFDDETHTYVVDGVVVPSVTQIIAPLGMDIFKVKEEVLAKASKRGTAVHNAIDIYLSSGLEIIEDEYRGYFDAFLKFYNSIKNEWNVVATEKKFFSEIYNYCGTIDLILQNKSNPKHYAIMDWKTTSVIHDKQVTCQLTGYKLGILEQQLIDADAQLFVCRLSWDGTYEFKEFKNEYKIFTKLLDIAHYIGGK